MNGSTDERLVGVDFSGAANAGDTTWVATAAPDGDGLRVESCRPLRELTGTADRGPCLVELRSVVRDADAAGIDVSFGLPRAVQPRDTWEGMVEWFAETVDDVDDFVEHCVERARTVDADATYLQRTTDGPVGASSPYFWLVQHQTFHALRDVVAPLHTDPAVTFRPMQDGEGTTVCEVYPAGTLDALGLPRERYKDDSRHPDAPARRETIVDGLEREGVDLGASRERVLADAGGDALDAVVAAVAVDRARRRGFEPARDYDPVEGHIYT